jgi:hypothetical protein
MEEGDDGDWAWARGDSPTTMRPAELAKLLTQPAAPARLERLMAVRGAVLPVQRQAYRYDAANICCRR